VNRLSIPRLLLGTSGALMVCYGTWRILGNAQATKPVKLGEWLLAAIVLHDGVLAWLVLGAGWLVARVVPRRARAYVQGALVCGALLTLVALPLIYRRGHAAPGLTLLRQDYAAHLALLLGIVAAVGCGAWAVRVLRDRRQRDSSANERPPADQTSPTP
jgi:hypothetical protein